MQTPILMCKLKVVIQDSASLLDHDSLSSMGSGGILPE